MDYNNTYKNSNNAWGAEPNRLLQMIIDDIPKNTDILDLGSAQGRDALYLASNNFNVTAVEKSEIGHNQLVKAITENNVSNINPINSDIYDFDIVKDKYLLINIQNALQFLPKEKSLALINNIKIRLKSGGIITISAFTVDDPSFKNTDQKIKSHFDKQELLKLFADFQIIYYFEKKILDKGHASAPEPHFHGTVKIIAKKI